MWRRKASGKLSECKSPKSSGQLTARLEGVDGTVDGSELLLARTADRSSFCRQLAAWLAEHIVHGLAAQWVYGLALEYAHLNCHDDSVREPSLEAGVGKWDVKEWRRSSRGRGRCFAGRQKLRRLQVMHWVAGERVVPWRGAVLSEVHGTS